MMRFIYPDRPAWYILQKITGLIQKKKSTPVTIPVSDTNYQDKKVMTIPLGSTVQQKRFSEGVLELVLEKSKS